MLLEYLFLRIGSFRQHISDCVFGGFEAIHPSLSRAFKNHPQISGKKKRRKKKPSVAGPVPQCSVHSCHPQRTYLSTSCHPPFLLGQTPPGLERARRLQVFISSVETTKSNERDWSLLPHIPSFCRTSECNHHRQLLFPANSSILLSPYPSFFFPGPPLQTFITRQASFTTLLTYIILYQYPSIAFLPQIPQAPPLHHICSDACGQPCLCLNPVIPSVDLSTVESVTTSPCHTLDQPFLLFFFFLLHIYRISVHTFLEAHHQVARFDLCVDLRRFRGRPRSCSLNPPVPYPLFA